MSFPHTPRITIRKQAKAKNWQRNLARRVQERVREKLMRAEVRSSRRHPCLDSIGVQIR